MANNQILCLVNAAAQNHCTENESLRLLQEAKNVAEIRNHRLDKGFELMMKYFPNQKS